MHIYGKIEEEITMRNQNKKIKSKNKEDKKIKTKYGSCHQTS